MHVLCIDLYDLIYVYYTYIHMFFYMLYIILLLHARIYAWEAFFIPCHGTSAACGSSKQASRTARPDSLMILSIRDNLRLIH